MSGTIIARRAVSTGNDAGPDPREPVISARDVKREYIMGKAVVHALRGVSFQVYRGEFVSIMGPSGSGKSTLLHLIGCLDTPTSGSLSVEGQDVSSMSERDLAFTRNRRIGFVFQQFNLLSRMNVLENVMTPLMYANVPARERKIRAAEALARVGLSDRMHHLPSELSGGQQQRSAIARALVNEPSIILADEPTGALDTDTVKTIMGIFQEINRQGTTVMVVTHDAEVGACSRRHIHLRDGLLEE
jgi:putative ABC transport system ATP-binding protein